MKPVLYRYRGSVSVIKPMEGYTPAEGWEPLYDQAAMDATVAAERERCAKVCESIHDAAVMSKYASLDECVVARRAALKCADAIRKGDT